MGTCSRRFFSFLADRLGSSGLASFFERVGNGLEHWNSRRKPRDGPTKWTAKIPSATIGAAFAVSIVPSLLGQPFSGKIARRSPPPAFRVRVRY
jgi:hypothetical protein